jgi:hypothetical protein
MNSKNASEVHVIKFFKFIKKVFIVVTTIYILQGFSSLYRSMWGELEYLIKNSSKSSFNCGYEENNSFMQKYLVLGFLALLSL